MTSRALQRRNGHTKSDEQPRLTDLHMIVLSYFARDGLAFADEVGRKIGLPASMVERLCADLEAAGLIESCSGRCR